MVMGRAGSGKSTFGYELHKQTNINLYHLDKYFFKDGWVERNYQEFISIQQGLFYNRIWFRFIISLKNNTVALAHFIYQLQQDFCY